MKMQAVNLPIISGAVEGIVDESVLRCLVRHMGATPGPIHIKNGKGNIHSHILGYNNAARLQPWVVLIDLNHDECAPGILQSWLPTPASHMCFRIAVREIEAWLLADRDSIAHFLGVNLADVPTNPEEIANPKQTMVALATNSRRREIRQDMVPRATSGRVVGPAYSSRLIEFAENAWQPQVASRSSDSLNRCLACLQRLVNMGVSN